jgi:hypothetical protein
MINSGIVAFCDSSKLVSQLYDIGWQNGKIGSRRSDMHDDHANAAAVEQGKGSMPLTDTPQGCRPPLDISGSNFAADFIATLRAKSAVGAPFDRSGRIKIGRFL